MFACNKYLQLSYHSWKTHQAIICTLRLYTTLYMQYNSKILLRTIRLAAFPTLTIFLFVFLLVQFDWKKWRKKNNNIELVYKTLTTHSHLLSDRNYVLIRYTQYLWSSAASFRAFISPIQHWKRILLSNGAIKYLCGNFSYNFVVVCDWNQIYYVYVM